MLPMHGDEDGELFTLPLPPPPPGGPQRDILFVRRDGPSPREHEDIMLRRVPAATARRFRAAAGGRALTHAQYLGALVELHETIRTRADAGDAELGSVLDGLGLQSVTV